MVHGRPARNKTQQTINVDNFFQRRTMSNSSISAVTMHSTPTNCTQTDRHFIFYLVLAFKHNKISIFMQFMITKHTKKCSEEMQTLHAGCSKAEPKIFAPPQTPFLRARDGQNLISWRWSLPLHINPVWRGSVHAISSYRGNRLTHTHHHTHPPTHKQTGPITIHCAAASLVHSVIKLFPKCAKVAVNTETTQQSFNTG